jgi:hypothetical protein
MFFKFDHYALVISEVSHYRFLKEMFLLEDPLVGFKKIKIKNKKIA